MLSPTAYGQDTRTEAINQERQDKQARLWPERESPMVRQANGLIERGFREGIEDGMGANGFTPVLGGMRSGHGMSFGGAYRKTDIWGEHIGVRGTARLTLQDAYMVDGRLDFQGLEFERGFFNLYGKYEHSPRMDFYGLGPFSSQDERTSYLLEDFSTDFQFGVELSDNWRVGFTGGATLVYTGVGRRPGFPSTSDEFTLRQAPGIGLGDLEFSRWGGSSPSTIATPHREPDEEVSSVSAGDDTGTTPKTCSPSSRLTSSFSSSSRTTTNLGSSRSVPPRQSHGKTTASSCRSSSCQRSVGTTT